MNARSRRRRRARREKQQRVKEQSRVALKTIVRRRLRQIERSHRFENPTPRKNRQQSRSAKDMDAPLGRAGVLHERQRIRHSPHNLPEEKPREAPRCKSRPVGGKSKGGASRRFIPWCEKRR